MPQDASSYDSTRFVRTERMPSGKSVHTVPLEAQGIPADIADYRRSVLASTRCSATVAQEVRSRDSGRWYDRTLPCQNPPIALIDNQARCAEHRFRPGHPPD